MVVLHRNLDFLELSVTIREYTYFCTQNDIGWMSRGRQPVGPVALDGQDMPIYEYECAGCGIRFERLAPIWASATPSCDCGSHAVRRLVSRPALLRQTDVGFGRAAYPTSWEQTEGGDRETVLHWQRRVERERKQEAANPELVALRAAAADHRWQQAHPAVGTGVPAGAGHHHGHSHASLRTAEIHDQSSADEQATGAVKAQK